MTAFVKSGEARCGSLAIQYRYAAGSPRPANIATTGGQRTTTSRSPRPAGPRARAPIRLETTVDRMIVTSVMMISLALRAITSYSIPKNVELATECSACAARQDDGGYGAKQNRSIESQRPTVDVFEIQLHPLFKRKVAATGNLPQASYAGLHTKAPFLPRQFHSHRIAHRQRARADNAHVAEQHVDQLRQLIDAGLAQPTTGARDPRIVADLENRAFCIKLDGNCLHYEQGRKNEQQYDRGNQIKNALGFGAPTEQRSAVHRDDRHAVKIDRLRSRQLLREEIGQHVRRNSLLFQQQHNGFDLRVLRFDGQSDRDFVDDFVGHDARQVFDGAEPWGVAVFRLSKSDVGIDVTKQFVSQVMPLLQLGRKSSPALSGADDYERFHVVPARAQPAQIESQGDAHRGDQRQAERAEDRHGPSIDGRPSAEIRRYQQRYRGDQNRARHFFQFVAKRA